MIQRSSAADPDLDVAGLTLRGASAELAPGVIVRAARIEAPRGGELEGRGGSSPRLELHDVRIEADVEALLAPLAQVADASALRALDAVSGRASVDAIFGVAAHPAIPRVRNEVRLDIVEGAIDFGQLERGFHRLVDAVLHFKVRDGRLELEKDVPFVPWDQATLVGWDLDPDEQALASGGRVRLRRLLDAKVHDARVKSSASKGGAGCYAFGSIALEAIDVAVSIGPEVDVPLLGGALHLGRDDAPAVDGLELRGSLRCTRDRPETSTIAVAVRAVTGALRGLHAFGVTLDAERFTVESVTGEVAFESLTPTRIALAIPRVTLEGVRATVGD